MSNPAPYTSALSDVRKKELLSCLPKIMTDLPTSVLGNQSLAQEIVNRIESITKKSDEFKYLVDAVTYLIDKSKGAEIQIILDGKVLSRSDLAKKYGIFLTPKIKKSSLESSVKSHLKSLFSKK